MLKRILLCGVVRPASIPNPSLNPSRLTFRLVSVVAVLLLAVGAVAQGGGCTNGSACELRWPDVGGGGSGVTFTYTQNNAAVQSMQASAGALSALIPSDVEISNGSMTITPGSPNWNLGSDAGPITLVSPYQLPGGAGGGWGGEIAHSGGFFGATGYQSSTWREGGWSGGAGVTNTGSIEMQAVARAMPLVLMASGGGGGGPFGGMKPYQIGRMPDIEGVVNPYATGSRLVQQVEAALTAKYGRTLDWGELGASVEETGINHEVVAYKDALQQYVRLSIKDSLTQLQLQSLRSAEKTLDVLGPGINHWIWANTPWMAPPLQ